MNRAAQGNVEEDLLPAQNSVAGAAVLDYDSNSPQKLWRVRSLVYTQAGLISVFFWMLWGDFVFSMMESVMPQLLPLTLRDLKVSNATIGLLVGTLPGLMNMIVTPIISYKSDRYRSRLGRRIPFLLFPTPMVVICLILTGYSPSIGTWIHRTFFPHASQMTVLIWVIAIAVVSFQFFDMFVASIYWYLVNDVIPGNVMGRFYGLVRVVGSGAGIAFGLMMGWGNEHRGIFYTIVAVAYGVAFTLTCWGVKEGEYPPPPADGQRTGFWGNVKIYFRECYSHPYYLCFYLSASIFTLSERCFRLFRIFFAQEVGMSVATFGKIMAATSVVSFCLYMPFGWLADKLHPIRMQLITMSLLPLISIISFFAIHSSTSFTVWFMIWWVVYTAHAAANGPLFPLLLPNNKFGQFCSAQSILGAIAIMTSSYAGGKLLDWIGDYRYVFAWNATFCLIALVFAVLVYRGWRKYGGPDHYVAPMSGESADFEVVAPALQEPALATAAICEPEVAQR